MTRINDLHKKYPTIPREVILKWEVLNRGIRDNEALDQISDWSRVGGSYQTYDHDVSLKEVMKKASDKVKPGEIKRPGVLCTENGIIARIQRDSKSPYQIRALPNGRFAIFEGEEQVDVDVYFPMPTARPEPRTSKGTLIHDLVTSPRQCFFIVPVRYCEYFATGEQCKFCNFNATQEDAKAIGLGRPVTIDLQDTVEAYKILGSEVRLLEGRLEMGGFMKSEHEGKIYFDFVHGIANAVPYKPNFTVHTEAMDRKDMQRLKDCGLDSITLQMEVWDPKLFDEICPGKAKHSPHARWIENLQEAVEIFGPGNVGAKIIAGLSMIPENGHKTWQEALASHVEGNRWLIKHGIMPVTTNLRLPPGSVYGEDSSNRAKLPPTEYYLELALAHHQDMEKYGLYEKLNKLMYCGMDCAGGIYCGELGMLEKAGDVGNWLSDRVPAESNWLADFIASVKPKSATPA